MKKLTVNRISKAFGNKHVLQDVSIELNQGELVGLLGVSGGGKSTLFNIISGLLSPDKGEVFLNGNNVTNKPGSITYMMQKDLLLPYKTIEDNVALPLLLNGMRKKQARQYISPLFSHFGLEGTQKKYPSQLSGGMCQRAALMRSYIFSQDVILLDEPFSALDAITKKSIHKWYLDIVEKMNISTLFITHDIDEAILLSDRIYLLSDSPGRIIGEFVIDEPKPRNDKFNLSTKFIEYKKEILSMIDKAI